LRMVSQMSIFVFPTVWEMEGFGLVAAEALSYGVPVVASDAGGNPEVVNDGFNGYVVKSREPKAFAGKLLKIKASLKITETYGW